ncbi:tRNA pseudouridine synthase A [Gammaproteobacteria bacterium]|nr:tRNA pseudouridine(38-40) synthase TruA [Gammaproteobacteria bacterium]CAG0939046.1 tRNA pseudouridine synthase A [Gammaproteobacteria bacterium]
MPRLAIGLEYDGTPFCGWQRQQHARSIQAEVEAALSRVADAPIAVAAAGRTDAGVHALGQVAHFDTDALRGERAWLLGANSLLPPEIAVGWVRQVSGGFDARYSALARTYHYLILDQPARPALRHNRVMWVRSVLDVAAMRAATPALLGEHDFSAFRAAGCQARSPMRELQKLEVRRDGSLVVVECRANAFLHHMVRNIVGSLLRIGRGLAAPEWLAGVLAGRDRRAAGMTAAAAGLYLSQVHYPDELEVPRPAAFRPGDL